MTDGLVRVAYQDKGELNEQYIVMPTISSLALPEGMTLAVSYIETDHEHKEWVSVVDAEQDAHDWLTEQGYKPVKDQSLYEAPPLAEIPEVVVDG